MLEQVIANKAGWTRLRFDEMAVNVTERVQPEPDDNETYVGLEHLDSGSLRVRRWGSEVALKGTKLRMREGDILFARRNAYLRRVALAPHDGLFSAHGMVLRAKPETVLPEFLPFLMQSDLFMERALSISVGSLSPTINWKALAKEEFLLPPIQEQARLVEVLSASESCKESYRECSSVTSELRSSLIFNHFSQPVEGGLNRLLGISLTELCSIRTGKLDSNAAVEGGKYPYFTCDPVPKSIDTFAFDCDAVLLPGNNAQGQYWVKTFNGKFNAYQRTYVFEPDRSMARTGYLALFLEDALERLKSFSVGSTTKYLTKDLFEKLVITLPSLGDQDEFVEQIAALDRTSSQIKLRIEALAKIPEMVLAESNLKATDIV